MNPKWDLALRHLPAGTTDHQAAQWMIRQYHYLHRWPDPRTSTEAYAVDRPWLNSGHRYRIEQQPTVGDLVHPGDLVRTSYGTGGLVIAVCPVNVLCSTVRCWTIIYVIPDEAHQNKAGEFNDVRDYNWLNDLVAVGDRILKLFENNHDEVFVVPAPDEALRLARPAQLRLL